MREAVNVIFKCADKIFMIKRQDYLLAFPGYHSFPGGKVDKGDEAYAFFSPGLDLGDSLSGACLREVREELGFDLQQAYRDKLVVSSFHLGTAHTPAFNPYRFKSYFVVFELTHEIEFEVDDAEAIWGGWEPAKEFYNQYQRGEILTVPPTTKILKNLSESKSGHPWDVDFLYDEEKEVPCIESLSEVSQLIPLSNTLPPANRTNCFYLGEEKRVLVDPAPKNLEEYERVLKTLGERPVHEIFLTHHHIDHRQFADKLAEHFAVPLSMSATTKEFIKNQDKNFLIGREVLLYKEGDTLTSWKGKDIQILEVPGHDNGQLALMPTCRSWCLVGDLIQGIGSVVISRPEGNMKLYFESLKKIIALGPKYIYPSHGIAMGGVHRLEETLKHRIKRENQILKLSREGQNLDQMLHTIYPDLNEKLLPFAKINILGHLDKLEEEKRINF